MKKNSMLFFLRTSIIIWTSAESNLLHEYRNDELEGASLFQICRAVWKLNGAGRVAVLKYAEYLGTDPDYLLHPEDA